MDWESQLERVELEGGPGSAGDQPDLQRIEFVGKIPGLYCQFVGLSSQLVKLAVTLKCLPKKQKPEWRGAHGVTVDSEQAWPLGSVAELSQTGICNHLQSFVYHFLLNFI